MNLDDEGISNMTMRHMIEANRAIDKANLHLRWAMVGLGIAMLGNVLLFLGLVLR